MKYNKSVINLTAWKESVDPPIVPDTYRSNMHPRMESQASGPAYFIISRA